MKARFTPSLITGNEMIDSHHKELIKRANDLFEAIEGRESKEKVLETLDFLAEYTTYHFGAEEKLMQEAKYPKYNEHKGYHEALVQVVGGLQEKLKNEGPTEEFEKEVNEKVVDWLYTHIKGCDHELAEYKNVRSQVDNML